MRPLGPFSPTFFHFVTHYRDSRARLSTEVGEEFLFTDSELDDHFVGSWRQRRHLSDAME
jgi:hypothetical protein